MYKFFKRIFFKLKEYMGPMKIKSGCIPDHPDNRDLKKELPFKLTANVDSFNLKKYLTCGILNQRNTSACTGYAGAYAMNILINRQLSLIGSKSKDISNFEFKSVSPTWIYYNARKIEGFSLKEDTGSTIRSIFKALKNPGSIDIGAMDCYYDVLSDPPKNIDSLPKYNINSYFRIFKDSSAVEIMQRVLDVEQLPIVCGIKLFQDQVNDSYYNGGILDYTNISNDRYIGGHAVCIIGYKHINDKLYFTIVNSWGSNYGDKGFCYLPSDVIQTDNVLDIWTFDKKYF